MQTNGCIEETDIMHVVTERLHPPKSGYLLFFKKAGWFVAEKLHIDLVLLGLLLVLIFTGLLILYSASEANIAMVQRQGVHFVLGLVFMLCLAHIEVNYYRRIAFWLFMAGVVLLLLVLFSGIDAKGARRWLYIPGLLRFQPSELMKLVVPISVVCFITSRSAFPPDFVDTLKALAMIILPAGLIVVQPDLGTAILIASSGIMVLFLAGLSWKFMGSSLLLLLITAPLIWFFLLLDYHKKRILILFDPLSDPLGAGWNINQSIIAIGSGGLFGKGWLQGTQSQLRFLPESHTDFIVSVLAEERGLIGLIFILCLYLLIVCRGMIIAISAYDSFSRLLAGSITLIFFVYVFVNIGMVSGMLPVVGVPLPLVSFGGTSIITLMASFGILMSIATHKKIVHK